MKVAYGPHGLSIEPPLNAGWDEPTKLDWKASVTALDTGLTICIHPAQGRPGGYAICVGSRSAAPFDYASAWTFLNGVSVGAGEAGRAAE